MARSPNAEIAAQQFLNLLQASGYAKGEAWKAIAQSLLSCKQWVGGWQPFHDVILYREANDFKPGNAVMQRAENLTQYVAKEIGVSRADLCSSIGLYWQTPVISTKQPNNLVGHAFRSMLVEALKKFGDPGITYEEEVPPADEFPGHVFPTRSKNAKLDIVARRGKVTVALISSRWRFRHDRVDMIDEAMAYVTPARRANPNCQLYVWLGEFAPNRLHKVLQHCPPSPNPVLSAAVHFQPKLVTDPAALGENGRTVELKSMDWIIDQSFKWK